MVQTDQLRLRSLFPNSSIPRTYTKLFYIPPWERIHKNSLQRPLWGRKVVTNIRNWRLRSQKIWRKWQMLQKVTCYAPHNKCTPRRNWPWSTVNYHGWPRSTMVNHELMILQQELCHLTTVSIRSVQYQLDGEEILHVSFIFWPTLTVKISYKIPGSSYGARGFSFQSCLVTYTSTDSPSDPTELSIQEDDIKMTGLPIMTWPWLPVKEIPAYTP